MQIGEVRKFFILLREFFHSYGIILVIVLIFFNVLFYLILPGDYLSFLFGETVLVILLWISELLKSVRSRIEIDRLLTVKKLREYYERQASESLLFSKAYRILLEKTSPSEFKHTMVSRERIWIPGIIEKIFKGHVILEPVVRRNRIWVELVEELIKPYEEIYRNLFRSLGWNEFKIRPIEYKDRNETTIIKVEPTIYYYSFITNFSCDLPLGVGKTLRQLLEPLMLTENSVNPLKTIEELKDMPISNHMGINILIITKDGDLLLSERSLFVAVEQGSIAHTIAGSLDWKALIYITSKSNRADIRELALQEITEKEEISFPSPQDYKIYPIALTRNLRFLGKPDIQMIGIINRTTKELLERTAIGRKFESTKILRLKISNEPISFQRISRCDLLKLVSEKFAEPLLKGQELCEQELCEYVTMKRGRIKTKPAKIVYEKLSSNLIIGLYAYLKAYHELCNQ